MSTKKANERFSLLLKQKTIPWDEVATMLTVIMNNKNDDSILVSSCRQALARACLDRSISLRVMKLLLQKTSGDLQIEDRVKLVIKSVRCKNRTATQCLIEHDNFSILYWRDVYRLNTTLLHLICTLDGWNEEIAYVSQATLEQQQDNYLADANTTDTTTSATTATTDGRSHNGMFERNSKGKTPLRLSLEAGADFSEIVHHLKTTTKHTTESFEKHLAQLPELIAEYCDDMSILQDLMDEYPTLLQTTDDRLNSTPLHFACYYQNQEMIRLILDLYARRGERRRKLWNHLVVGNNSNKDGISPLGYLILGLGSMDAGNAFACVQICMTKVRNLPILHYAIDKMWGKLVEKQACLRTISRIVERLEVDLTSVDHGKSALVLLILKLTSTSANEKATTTTTTIKEEDKDESSSKEKSEMDSSEMFMEYVLTNCEQAARQKDGKKRLPLHVACENGLQWQGGGLRQLVNANVFGLEEVDPKSGLLPFALSASCPSSSLSTIYALLRYNPGVL
jgi:hypothetical protein